MDVIQGAFRAIVEAHIAGLSFHSVWTPVKDEQEDFRFPLCMWGASETQERTLPSYAIRPSFVLDCMFLEQTATDRTAAERDMAHTRMDAIARQVWAKFHATYIASEGTYQGVTLDFDPLETGLTRFLPIWDDGPLQVTGVRFQTTIVSGAKEDCVDTYFDAS